MPQETFVPKDWLDHEDATLAPYAMRTRHSKGRLAGQLRAGGVSNNTRHGLRLVEILEYRYPDFPGLNLSWEVLEAQAMHSKQPEAPEVKPFLAVGQPLLEAQVVDAADSLA